jgi:DNA-binding Lrp family transcriptional regulator
MIKSFRHFSIAYKVFNHLGEKRTSSRELAEQLGLSIHMVKAVVEGLAENKIVKTIRGTYNPGVEKIPDVDLSAVFVLYEQDYSKKDEIVKSIDFSIGKTEKRRICYVCSRKLPATHTEYYCSRCIKEEEPKKQMARCGHLSATRYFKCEDCLPELPSDEEMEYAVHL